MKRTLTFLTTLIGLSLLLLTACAAPATPTPAPTTAPTPTAEPTGLKVTDDLGSVITLDGPAERIVALGPSIIEGLFAIGAGDQIVGREEFSLYPPEAQEITSVGSLFGDVPSEAILALEPDLVIAPEIISQQQVATLQELGLTVYYQTNPTTFDELYQKLADLGELTAHESEAASLAAALEQRVQAVEEALAGVGSRPRVFYELDATDPQNPYTTGAGTFIDTLITMAGGENVGAALEGQYAQISSEQVILSNPQVILLADAEFGVTPEDVAARPGWEAIQAVQESRIYPFDPNQGSIPGPRLVDGLEAMARQFHPDLFQD